MFISGKLACIDRGAREPTVLTQLRVRAQERLFFAFLEELVHILQTHLRL